MKVGSLFTGYGGLDLAVEAAMGATPAWVAEVDPAPARVLAVRYPGVPNLGDVTAVNWWAVEPVDILTGGTPCQDVSHAGNRAGFTPGTRSNLWVAMREAIAVLRPRLVVWENVRGVLSARADSNVEPCPGCVGDGSGRILRALGRVVGDLASLGYDAEWTGLRASDVGAPHGRFRVFLTAHPYGAGWGEQRRAVTVRPEHPAAERPGVAPGLTVFPTPSPFHAKNTESPDEWLARREDVTARTGTRHGLPLPVVAWSLFDGNPLAQTGNGPQPMPDPNDAWGPYGEAVRRWEHLTRPAPAPTEPGADGDPQLSPAFMEWMMGLPAGWVTDVGVSSPKARKMLGNGVVPQQAAEALDRLAWVR